MFEGDLYMFEDDLASAELKDSSIYNEKHGHRGSWYFICI